MGQVIRGRLEKTESWSRPRPGDCVGIANYTRCRTLYSTINVIVSASGDAYELRGVRSRCTPV